MKRIYHTTLNQNTKKDIALYTQEYLHTIFSNKITTRDDLLHAHIPYFYNKTLPETVVKQTLAKAHFPRWSEQKNTIVSVAKKYIPISEKLVLEKPAEKTDFRGFGELFLASDLATTYEEIKKLTLNTENPTKPIGMTVTVLVTSKNSRPDFTICLNNQINFMLDAKSGNNANHPFSGIAASVPYTKDMKPYYVLNDKTVILSEIQRHRRNAFNLSDHPNSGCLISDEISHYIHFVVNLDNLDDVVKNKLIQQKMFSSLTSEMISKKKPSFFHGFIKGDSPELNIKFYEQLESHITANIFDSKEKSFKYIQEATKSYHENVQSITEKLKHLNNGGFGDTGFNNIDISAFK